MIKGKCITKVNWLANFLDLHYIEDIWDWKKEILGSKWKKFRGTRKRVQGIAQRKVAKV